MEWLVNTFEDFYDITYFSAHPYVNSQGLSLDNFHNCSWKAINHFSKIIDVWDKGWDKKLGTVAPFQMNRIFLQNRDERKNILHYIQPHTPYFSFKKSRDFINSRNKSRVKLKRTNKRSGTSKLKSLIGWYLKKSIGQKNTWRIKSFLNMPPGPFERVWRKNKIEKLSNYYENNLRMVSEAVSGLIKKLEGDIVITSDHGEFLGENGNYGHFGGSSSPILKEVPWLSIKTTNY